MFTPERPKVKDFKSIPLNISSARDISIHLNSFLCICWENSLESKKKLSIV